MHISELVVYPIKSLRGINVDRWPMEKRGLRYDRRWMVVDENGIFITARKLTRMAMIDTSFTGSGIRIGLKEHGEIEFPFQPQGEEFTAEVWGTPCDALRVGKEVDQWLSDALGQPCSLVYMPDSSERQLQAPGAQQGELIGFSDSNPVLVASQASIDDLNSRLKEPLPMRRFRPNIVVEDCGPFEEDTWPGLSIGEVQLRYSKKCGRCIFTTIDIETGETSDEPLRTLATYRKEGSHVWFGSFYVPESLGEVAIGDKVQITSR